MHRSAFRHGVEEADVRNAVHFAFVIDEMDPDEDPVRTIAVGPDRSGNLLEVIWVDGDDGEPRVIHAMKLRPKYFHLLSNEDPS